MSKVGDLSCRRRFIVSVPLIITQTSRRATDYHTNIATCKCHRCLREWATTGWLPVGQRTINSIACPPSTDQQLLSNKTSSPGGLHR